MPLTFINDELRALAARGHARRMRPIDGAQGRVVTVDGRPALNFSSNDYLGLAADARLRDAARNAMTDHGLGAGSSRLVAGSLGPHRRLEVALAAFHGREAALLFNSGYHANLGVLSALSGPEDVVFSDELNHASLIDGCKLARTRVVVYPHGDTATLARLLAEAPVARRKFVVTDTLFSMDGDFAQLPALRALADTHGAALVVDEAHATGVVGPGGRGLAAAHGIVPDVHIATLGKAFGVFGAYVTGSAALITFLVNRARSFVFTTALPVPVVAAATCAVTLVQSRAGDELRARLTRSCDEFAAGLVRLGLARGPAHPAPGPIFPVHVGDDHRVMEVSERLLGEGIFVQGIRPPTVAPGSARLRFSLSAAHEPDDVQLALRALAQLVSERALPQVPR